MMQCNDQVVPQAPEDPPTPEDQQQQIADSRLAHHCRRLPIVQIFSKTSLPPSLPLPPLLASFTSCPSDATKGASSYPIYPYWPHLASAAVTLQVLSLSSLSLLSLSLSQSPTLPTMSSYRFGTGKKIYVSQSVPAAP